MNSCLSRRHFWVLGLFLLISVIPCSGKIVFSGLDLAEDDRLLFTARSSGGGSVNQSALFVAQLDDRSVSMLSAFPEKMELTDGGQTILIHNAFGSQELPVSGGLPRSFPGFSAFANSPGSRVESTNTSPNGRWLLFVEPSSFSRGTLVLLDGVSGQKTEISFDVECPGRFFPALWGADSRGFLYTKGGRLYFYSVVTEAPPPPERYRMIGVGTIPSLYWGSGETFYYLRSSTIYRVRSNELFVRTLYPGFLELGEIAGKIPFDFDPNFDRFWISPDGLSLLLCKGGRNLFYYPLGIKADTETDFASLPYIMAPNSGSRVTVLWSAGGIATILVGSPKAGHGSPDYNIAAYRLTIGNNGAVKGVFETLENPPAFEASLSPDGTRVLFWGKDGLFLYDYSTWKQISQLVSGPVYSCLWLKNNELIVGGEEKIENLSLQGNEPGECKLICLSAISRYGFESSSVQSNSKTPRRILAFSGTTWYVTDGESPWTVMRFPSLREAVLDSERYRVYLEDYNAYFENIPMVRNLASVGTFRLFESGKNNTNRGKSGSQIALCFDIYDDVSGVSVVLDALARFGVRATFFVNGEFIRRHPQAAKELALSGHEIASMFFAPLDLSDARYRIDKTFVTRGLARNEDEYYKATGKELVLLWHPPYYFVSAEIAEAAATAGYRTVNRDIDCRDWIPSGEARRLGISDLSAAEIIDYIMDNMAGGNIVPIRLGLLEGGRADYLYNSLEVLLDALVREGYELVPVSTLTGKK